MAEVCPNCKSTDVQENFQGRYCLTCGRALTVDDGGESLSDTGEQALDLPAPADTSLATATATPVYAEQEKDRQPAVDTNIQAVPSNAKPGVNRKPVPDAEAQNVAGELSDETPQEKKAGGPGDQPRTADLTKTGKPLKTTLVDHSTDDTVGDTSADESTPADVHDKPTEPRPGDPAKQDDPTPKRRARRTVKSGKATT